MFRRLWLRLSMLWKLARTERASPNEIGWAVAIGAFAGCTPAIGFHGMLALGLATIFKKSRLFAWLASRISNMFSLPFIAIAEVQLAHRLRTGSWVTIHHDHTIAEVRGLLLDWCLGTLPVGVAIGLVLGTSSWALARRRERRRADALRLEP